MINLEIYRRERKKKLDQEILEYIKKEPSDHYENVFKIDKRWEVFYHLSQMRTSILNWYDFKENSEILEIGGGFGALTGLLCKKCAKVVTFEASEIRAEGIKIRYKEKDNLKIVSGTYAEEFLENEKFDYVFFNGEEFFENRCLDKEEYIKLFQKVRSLLKEDGIMLFSGDNRYGIRYFCGEVEPKTGCPFLGINGDSEIAGYLFSRSQLMDYIHKAGFPDCKFYYPMPSNQFPQLIYSDEYLPQKDICERLVFYYRNLNSLVASERNLYADILDNHAFQFMANSFLVECGKRQNFSEAIYAAVSTDRGREHSFATVVCRGDIVKKMALYSEGKRNEDIIFQNLMDLKEHGLKIVPHKKENNGLSMPYMKEITFSDYLRNLVLERDNKKFVKLLDRLYTQILQSSEHEDEKKSEFPIKEGENLKLGVILRKAYIDMVPFNCFYKDGEFYFFDQEFVRDYYPAAYTMFRAIKYTYLSIPETQTLVPIEQLKEKYQLEKNWEVFEEEEKRFVNSNRRYDVYEGFYSWTFIDGNRMKKNAESLSMD